MSPFAPAVMEAIATKVLNRHEYMSVASFDKDESLLSTCSCRLARPCTVQISQNFLQTISSILHRYWDHSASQNI